MKYHIWTSGCQMNVADSQLILGQLGRYGYEPTDDPESADVLLVNTCAVRDNAEQRVLGRKLREPRAAIVQIATVLRAFFMFISFILLVM